MAIDHTGHCFALFADGIADRRDYIVVNVNFGAELAKNLSLVLANCRLRRFARLQSLDRCYEETKRIMPVHCIFVGLGNHAGKRVALVSDRCTPPTALLYGELVGCRGYTM